MDDPQRPRMDDPQRRLDTFVRGLVAGAVAGAVIAGATLLQRRRRAPILPADAEPSSASSREPRSTSTR